MKLPCPKESEGERRMWKTKRRRRGNAIVTEDIGEEFYRWDRSKKRRNAKLFANSTSEVTNRLRSCCK
jgi:hypothetical protein